MRRLGTLEKDVHPMTQLSIGVLSLQKYSKFAHAYRNGVNKKHYWETFYEDSLNLMAKLPRLAAIIYNNVYHNGRPTPVTDKQFDLAQNFANMLGHNSKEFQNLLAHYLVLHSDHEGGNVSAHTVHLTGSALADPYLAYSAGLNGYLIKIKILD